MIFRKTKHLRTLTPPRRAHRWQTMTSMDNNHNDSSGSTTHFHAKELPQGLYGLSNHLLDTSWPKLEKAKQGVRQVLQSWENPSSSSKDSNNNNEDDSTWHASIVVRLVILGAAMLLLVVSQWMGRQWTARIQQHQFQSVRQQDEEEEGDEHGYHEISMTDIGAASGAASA